MYSLILMKKNETEKNVCWYKLRIYSEELSLLESWPQLGSPGRHIDNIRQRIIINKIHCSLTRLELGHTLPSSIWIFQYFIHL